jgi:hypothetical protein
VADVVHHVGDPVASHDRRRILQLQRLRQGTSGEERPTGAEDHRDLVDDHLVDKPELERREKRPDLVVSSAMNPSRETTAPMIVLPVVSSFPQRSSFRPFHRDGTRSRGSALAPSFVSAY